MELHSSEREDVTIPCEQLGLVGTVMKSARTFGQLKYQSQHRVQRAGPESYVELENITPVSSSKTSGTSALGKFRLLISPLISNKTPRKLEV